MQLKVRIVWNNFKKEKEFKKHDLSELLTVFNEKRKRAGIEYRNMVFAR